jgi:hypothetical protein
MTLVLMAGCGNTITQYQIGRDKGDERWVALSPSEYSVDTDHQRVVRSTAGFLARYDDCAVKDRRNWECRADGKDWIFGFRNGDYWEMVKIPVLPNFETRNVSAWEWWFTKWGIKIKS